MTSKKLWRVFFYLLGLFLLALGLTLNNLCELGTSAMSTPAYFASLVWGVPFGDGMLVFYLLCVVVQLVLKPRGEKLPVLAQILVCLVFTRLLNLLGRLVVLTPTQLWEKWLLLAVSILLTGVGVALNLNGKLIPNPGDGIIEVLTDFSGKERGLVKNLFDLFCMAVTLVMGLVTGHLLWAVGIGTLLGVVGVGRVIAVFDRLFKARLDELTGTTPQ